MPLHRPSSIIRQIESLLNEDPTSRLLLFVPRRQIGHALQCAVVRTRGGTSGFTGATLLQYAQNLAALSLRANGKSELTPGLHYFLVSESVRALSSEKREALTGSQSLSGLIRPLARSVTTFRTHDITPERYRKRTSNSPRHRAHADVFQRYEEMRIERGVYDSSDVYARASTMVKRGTIDLSITRFAILETVSLSVVQRDFLLALAAHSADEAGLRRIGSSAEAGALSPPSTVAATQFCDWPKPSPPSDEREPVRALLSDDAALSTDEAQSIRFWTAIGTRREIQAVLEDIVAKERRLDTVEIAYTTPDPYLAELDILSDRYDIPVSISGGRSIDATRPGQLLDGFYDWINNGCTIPGLIDLLRSGLLQIDHIFSGSEDDSTMDSREAAALLAETRYPNDPSDYREVFETWRHRLDEEIQELDDADVDEPWIHNEIQELHQKKTRVNTIEALVQDLLDLSHITSRTPVSVKNMALSGETILERYGPTEKPTTSEEQHSPDEAARNRLIERLRTLTEQDFSSYAPQRLAGLMKTWISLTPFVRAQHARPGHAHIVPLESAGYTDRDHLYVLGLDSSSTQSRMPSEPLLSDDERNALSDEQRQLPLHRNRADREDWMTRRALARHSGTLTLSACTYDVTENEEGFEAPIFLQLKRASQIARGIRSDENDPQVVHHPLAQSQSPALSELDRWTSAQRPTSDQLEDAFTSHYPWIHDGLVATSARHSSSYTVYDGLLSPDTYEALDPLAYERPLSVAQLEQYAQSPFAYFLRHVLEVAPRDEPALDDVAWLDAKDRGAVLHKTFHAFMSEIDRPPTLQDKERLRDHFTEVIETKRDRRPPPSEVIYATTEHQLWTDALVFLRVEANRTDPYTPVAHEFGFGYPAHRQRPRDCSTVPTISLNGPSLSLRGRIDRIDRRADDTLSIWDYKTGSARNYDETDLLSSGEHLQWALYAYALEELEDEPVSTAGYFFTNTDEMGRRIEAEPNAHREAVAQALQHISEGAATGAFPLMDSDALRYDYNELFHDYNEDRKQWTAKEWPSDRPAPPSLRED